MDLSVVTTLYCSEPYLETFYSRMTAAAEAITRDFEIILVNDGSPDGALDVALSLVERDARVRVIDLSRNFGHHRPIMTGLSHARGNLVFLIDSDLEEDPELLEQFYKELTDSGADVVYGQQSKRRGDWWESLMEGVLSDLVCSPVRGPEIC
jgi:putative glycosyltransferase